MIRIHTVSYQIGTYSGTIEVTSGTDAETDEVLAKAKRLLRQRSGDTLPFGTTTFKIIDWRDTAA